MADKKISQLTAATTPLAGTEVLPIVQSGSTVKVSVDNLTTGKAVTVGSLSSAGAISGTTLTATGDVALNGGNFVFNDAGAAKTFRVETATYASAVDVQAGSIGFGKAPGYRMDIAAGSGAQLRWNNTSDSDRGWSVTTTTGVGVQFGTTSGVYPLIFAVDNVEKGRFETDNNFKVKSGNIVVETAAKGIDFSANTGAAGETSALLNWYEEGTWTPTITPSTSGAVTYTTQNGKYTRIGNLVVISFALAGSKNTASGEFRIGGIPFSMVSTGGITGAINWYQPGGTALVNAVAFYFSATAFRIGTLTAADVDATAGSYGSGLVSTTFSLTGSLFYFVS